MYRRAQFGLFPSGMTGFTVCSDEKSSSFWMFCRLSRSRSMSYSPLLSFGSSITVPGSAYLLAPPFGIGVPHYLRRRRDLLHPLLTSALRSGCLSALSVAEATQDRSPGVIPAAFCAQSPNLRFAPLMDYRLRSTLHARPTLTPYIRFLFIDSHICLTLPSDLTSRR